MNYMDNGNVPKFGLRGQSAKLLFIGSNPIVTFSQNYKGEKYG